MTTEERIAAEYYRFVFNVCRKFEHNTADAEDMTQNVFLVAARKRPEIVSRRAMESWLYRVAAWEFKVFLLRRKRTVSLEDLLERIDADDGQVSRQDLRDARRLAVEPETMTSMEAEEAARRETARYIADICRRLTATYRGK